MELTQAIYKDCLQKKAKQVRWNGVKELEQRERHLILNEMYRGQTDRAGLGFKKTQKLIKDMKPRQQHRQSLTSLVKDVDEDACLPVWLRQARTVANMGICHASRYIMEEAAVCMDTRAAVIQLQCCTQPTAISCKSETMGQNQFRLLSALSPQHLYTVSHPEWLQLLPANRAIQLAS